MVPLTETGSQSGLPVTLGENGEVGDELNRSEDACKLLWMHIRNSGGKPAKPGILGYRRHCWGAMRGEYQIEILKFRGDRPGVCPPLGSEDYGRKASSGRVCPKEFLPFSGGAKGFTVTQMQQDYSTWLLEQSENRAREGAWLPRGSCLCELLWRMMGQRLLLPGSSDL